MKLKDISVRIFRKSCRFLTKTEFNNPECIYNRQVANDVIYDLLVAEKSCMIARFGTTELITLNNYLCIKSTEPYLKKVWNFISDNTHTPWWIEENFNFLEVYSGVFPATKEISERFSQRYLEDIPLIDVLGSFQYYEKFMPLKKNIVNVHLETLYPFFVERPWTLALKGKKVLIVHPFEETIKHQYTKRIQLFQDVDTLPEFELITLKAVQSAAGVRPPFKDWFESLKFMEDQISKIDFDICILGCGAYGLPLAAHVKRIGKKAFHIGGGLQLLFGIKGKRWDNPTYGIEEFKMYPNLMKESYYSLYNKYWIRPLKGDTPGSSEKLDGGIYW